MLPAAPAGFIPPVRVLRGVGFSREDLERIGSQSVREIPGHRFRVAGGGIVDPQRFAGLAARTQPSPLVQGEVKHVHLMTAGGEINRASAALLKLPASATTMTALF